MNHCLEVVDYEFLCSERCLDDDDGHKGWTPKKRNNRECAQESSPTLQISLISGKWLHSLFYIHLTREGCRLNSFCKCKFISLCICWGWALHKYHHCKIWWDLNILPVFPFFSFFSSFGPFLHLTTVPKKIFDRWYRFVRLVVNRALVQAKALLSPGVALLSYSCQKFWQLHKDVSMIQWRKITRTLKVSKILFNKYI